MEENRIMEVETMENNEVMENYEPVTEETGNGIPVAAVGALVVGIGLGVAAVKKGKGKLEKWNIKRLEKKGYVVAKPGDIVEPETDSNEKESEEE